MGPDTTVVPRRQATGRRRWRQAARCAGFVWIEPSRSEANPKHPSGVTAATHSAVAVQSSARQTNAVPCRLRASLRLSDPVDLDRQVRGPRSVGFQPVGRRVFQQPWVVEPAGELNARPAPLAGEPGAEAVGYR